jgi:toxin-antitoxin system PIN domain toxin
MSFAIDANLLLYASDESSAAHEKARVVLEQIAAGPDLVYIFWPVAMAYLRIATHPRVFERPLTTEQALGNLARLLDRPHVRTPGEGDRFWPTLLSVTRETYVRGNLIPDAHLVALMREHGVSRIWTRDRDFRKFDDIDVIDPLA